MKKFIRQCGAIALVATTLSVWTPGPVVHRAQASAGQPDLTFTVVKPLGALVEQVVVINTGTAPAGQFSVTVTMDGFLKSVQNFRGLAPGATKTIMPLVAGIGNTKIIADAANQVVEANESNNVWKNYP